MPSFAEFNGKKIESKLNKEEMIRALRFSISAEMEAVQLYAQLSESSDDLLFKTVMKDIANEEIVHIGEFMRVLFQLAPEEQSIYEKGFKEVEIMIKKMKGLS